MVIEAPLPPSLLRIWRGDVVTLVVIGFEDAGYQTVVPAEEGAFDSSIVLDEDETVDVFQLSQEFGDVGREVVEVVEVARSMEDYRHGVEAELWDSKGVLAPG